MSIRESVARRVGGQQYQRNERLAEVTRQALSQNGLLAETVSRLEQEVTGDEDWRRLGAQLQLEFTRPGLDDLMNVSRAMYLVNPLIQRAVNVTTYYTWAQGWEYSTEDDRVKAEVVEPMLANEGNRMEFYGHQARILTDVDQLVDGNVFLALFTDPVGDVQVRAVPTEQIREIITHPQDANQVWFYRRTWSQREFDLATGFSNTKQYEVLYPDIRHQPANQPDSIGGVEVRWDAPIIHQATGGLKHMLFGLPQTYAALDWARAYKRFLEDWHTVVSSLARFAWRATASKSQAQKLRDRFGTGGGTGDELEEDPAPRNRRPPVPGAMWADKNVDLTPINKSGTTTSAEDAKQSRLMVGAAMDLPDTILSGDPQQGNLATAKSLDRPTELGFINRQTLWGDLDARIFRYVVDAKVRRGRMPGRVIRTPDGSVVEPTIDATVTTEYPPILESETGDVVNAIVAAATLQGKTDANTIPREELAKLLMSAVGVEDIDQALQDLDKQEQEDARAAVDALAKLAANPQPDQVPPPPPAPSANGAGA